MTTQNRDLTRAQRMNRCPACSGVAWNTCSELVLENGWAVHDGNDHEADTARARAAENSELAQLADQLPEDYNPTRAMQDLQFMSFMLAAGREDNALTCVNRVNAYLYRLSLSE
jgi:hypothetical protein